ncbi:MAG TPA: NTP transferase domain-containing protein, partial [Actinomycetota bacterium]|nr:NTP transferase domain-containing protein [Actinomycetota bacterium]
MHPIVHAGLLLTGGASTRMGRDKATIVAGGASLAERSAAALRAVAAPVLAVGQEASTGCAVVDDPRQG